MLLQQRGVPPQKLAVFDAAAPPSLVMPQPRQLDVVHPAFFLAVLAATIPLG